MADHPPAGRGGDASREVRPVLEGPLPHAIAHRGGALLWPENTMAAFGGAVDLGFRWLETDIHLTRDGAIVCLHDDTLDRTTTGNGVIWDHDLSELAEVDAGRVPVVDGVRPFLGGDVRIPTLDEVVTTFPDVRMVIELKQDGLEEPLADLIRRRDLRDRVIVGSFVDARLAAFRRLTGGRVATSTGSDESRMVWRQAWRGVPPTLADAIQVPRFHRGTPVVTRRTVAGFHRGGYQVHVWTVNRTAEMAKLLALGVDGIITDRPDLLRRLLEREGRWTGRR